MENLRFNVMITFMMVAGATHCINTSVHCQSALTVTSEQCIATSTVTTYSLNTSGLQTMESHGRDKPTAPTIKTTTGRMLGTRIRIKDTVTSLLYKAKDVVSSSLNKTIRIKDVVSSLLNKTIRIKDVVSSLLNMTIGIKDLIASTLKYVMPLRRIYIYLLPEILAKQCFETNPCAYCLLHYAKNFLLRWLDFHHSPSTNTRFLQNTLYS